eukprot:TRINITY_DN1319_c0_g2_i1.p1 TRINITY_DN1319_c0_g2~~TRINITY_DN1319_c0_g2_i1.p1  ORF type:complete len:383 (+),score=89.85 TRINITY_DN1319_c0_g2_i1:109-1257(+)
MKFYQLFVAIFTVYHYANGLDDGFEFMVWPDPSLGGPVGKKFLMTDAVKDGAMCLDGTPGAYYYSPSNGNGTNKWYIHMQGGGWCENLDSCLGRSGGDLGSSKNYPATANLGGGYFDNNPAVNPQMYNWNMVFMRYCDGGSFSGANMTVTEYKSKKLYFRGKLILRAMISDLLKNRGLNQATDVVVSGCSAGGLASWLHTDYYSQVLPKTTKVVGMPDSGFFLDYEAPGKKYHSGMIWVFNQMNATSGVHQGCIAGQAKDESWKCMFAQYTAPFIKTPMFPLQAEYDSWQTSQDLNSNDPKVINVWGANLTAIIQTNEIQKNPNHGMFWILVTIIVECGGVFVLMVMFRRLLSRSGIMTIRLNVFGNKNKLIRAMLVARRKA